MDKTVPKLERMENNTDKEVQHNILVKVGMEIKFVHPAVSALHAARRRGWWWRPTTH
jgi:hypothetical protein